MATNNVIQALKINNKTYNLQSCWEELGLSKDYMLTLLSRDEYTPVASKQPTSTDVLYTDPGSGNPAGFHSGQCVIYPDSGVEGGWGLSIAKQVTVDSEGMPIAVSWIHVSNFEKNLKRATSTSDGLMSSDDKKKLDGMTQLTRESISGIIGEDSFDVNGDWNFMSNVGILSSLEIYGSFLYTTSLRGTAQIFLGQRGLSFIENNLKDVTQLGDDQLREKAIANLYVDDDGNLIYQPDGRGAGKVVDTEGDFTLEGCVTFRNDSYFNSSVNLNNQAPLFYESPLIGVAPIALAKEGLYFINRDKRNMPCDEDSMPDAAVSQLYVDDEGYLKFNNQVQGVNQNVAMQEDLENISGLSKKYQINYVPASQGGMGVLHGTGVTQINSVAAGDIAVYNGISCLVLENGKESNKSYFVFIQGETYYRLIDKNGGPDLQKKNTSGNWVTVIDNGGSTGGEVVELA